MTVKAGSIVQQVLSSIVELIKFSLKFKKKVTVRGIIYAKLSSPPKIQILGACICIGIFDLYSELEGFSS
jgi:hypothetical protein